MDIDELTARSAVDFDPIDIDEPTKAAAIAFEPVDNRQTEIDAHCVIRSGNDRFKCSLLPTNHQDTKGCLASKQSYEPRHLYLYSTATRGRGISKWG